jgi:hypothetical protein
MENLIKLHKPQLSSGPGGAAGGARAPRGCTKMSRVVHDPG